jgi:hypothetical protein
MRYTLLFLSVLFITPVVWAEETGNATTPPALSLEEAQTMALKQHPEILSSDYRTKASKQAIKEARANYFPQANANAVRASELEPPELALHPRAEAHERP